MFARLLERLSIKDTDEKSDEKVHRARSRKVLSAGASDPVARRGTPLPARGSTHQYYSLLITVI